MKKPEQVYEPKWYIIVNYVNFNPRDGIYDLPSSFHNVGISEFDPEENPTALGGIIKDLFIEFCEDCQEEGHLNAIKNHEYRYIYYCKVENEDELIDLQDVLDYVEEVEEKTPSICVNDYNLIIKYLPQMQELVIKDWKPKNG